MHQARRECRANPCAVTSSLGMGDLDVESVELAVEGVTADIERLGDIAHVPTVLLQHLQQHLSLVGLNRIEFDRPRPFVIGGTGSSGGTGGTGNSSSNS